MTDHTQTAVVKLNNAAEGLALFGAQDKYLHLIERHTDARINTRDAEITIQGRDKEVESLTQLFQVLLELVKYRQK